MDGLGLNADNLSMRWCCSAPVGAASSTVRPIAWSRATITRVVVVVLPQPGPPRIEQRRSTAAQTVVFACSGLRAMPWRAV